MGNRGEPIPGMLCDRAVGGLLDSYAKMEAAVAHGAQGAGGVDHDAAPGSA